jgi:hypothetical protein
MSSTLAQHIPLSLLDRWEIDAQIEQDFKTRTNPVQATEFAGPPKPRPQTKPAEKPTQPDPSQDDGFTVVKKGYKKRTDHTSHTEIKVSHAFTALPSGKPSIPQGTGKSHKKNMKRKVKKTQAS